MPIERKNETVSPLETFRYDKKRQERPYKNMLRLFAIIIFLSAFSPLQAAEIPEQAQNLAPHKALYNIKLLSKRSGAQIVNVNGQMFYEWAQGCDAWETNHRFNLLYEYTDSPSMRITSDFSTFETFDGESLNFSSRRMRDGELFEEVRGYATAFNEKEGEVYYNLPEKMTYKMPKGGLFPMGHTMSVLEKLKKGEKIYNATIFDGSDEEGPKQVNAFIGKPTAVVPSVTNSKAIDQELLKAQAHKLRLAFFPVSEEEEGSEYEMDLTFHENGIISSMAIEYKDFAIAQELVALEPLGSSCDVE